MTVLVKNASLSFEDLAVLQDISFQVQDGDFASILAPSGAGKSSLLKAMVGSLSLDSGEIWVDGQLVTGVNSYFSYMPQDDMLLDWLTVYQNVTLYQRINRQAVDQDQVMAMLERAGLSAYKDYLPRQLSGGMRQRTAFVRSLINPAKTLLLDEPLGALDAMTRSLMQDWLHDLLADFPRTVILVTHDIEEAIYLSDRIYLLSARPAQLQEVYDIKADHRDRDWLAQQGGLKNEIYQQLQVQSFY